MENIGNDLREKDELFLDGTFNITPPGVTQLLVILTKKRNDTISKAISFIIISNKEDYTYSMVMKKLKKYFYLLMRKI